MVVVTVLLVLFAWPAGIVLGNLLANVCWLPIQWLGLHLKLKQHHDDTHGHLDTQDALLAEIRDLLASYQDSGRTSGHTCRCGSASSPCEPTSPSE